MQDLYELSQNIGAFSEARIGQIALQLLMQLREIHARDMLLLLLTPQNVLIRSNSDQDSPDEILVDIVNIVPMLLTRMKSPEGFSYVSGVDRLFLAPELNLCQVGP